MATGHWVPEMVELAGGIEVLGRAGGPSRYVTWEEIAEAAPEVLILMPCGFPIERTRRELPLLTGQSWWRKLPAVRDHRVYLVNGPAYFNRAGPRLIDGIELLAGLLHPGQGVVRVPGGSAVAGL
jgi:iron complex transport system substrate-binding protein